MGSGGGEVNLVDHNQKMKLNRLDRKYKSPSAKITAKYGYKTGYYLIDVNVILRMAKLQELQLVHVCRCSGL